MTKPHYVRSIIATCALVSVPAFADGPEVTVSPAVTDPNGFLVHDVKSPYQAGTTKIRVLLPQRPREGARMTVIYVLPVEAHHESRYGDGLLEIKRRELHVAHQVIFVSPAFSHLPWYADHPSDPAIRQETYLLKTVLPFIEKTYPAIRERSGRRLLGFSKSGWGAWSLLLRHPEMFERAVAWDAPMMMDKPGKYGSGPIFQTQENFEGYRISSLLRKQADKLQSSNSRLALIGYGSFRQEHQQLESLLVELKIPHIYRDGPHLKHDWHSGWVKEAVEVLVAER